MSLKLYCMAMQADLRAGQADASAPARKLVLMKFCDEASDDGRVPLAYAGKVSNARLAMAAMCSEDSVKRHKRQLVKEGWLVPDGNVLGGRGRAARYKVNLVKLKDAATAAAARLSGHAPEPDPRTCAASGKGVSPATLSGGQLQNEKGCQDAHPLSAKPLEAEAQNLQTVADLTPFHGAGKNAPKGCQHGGERVSALPPNPFIPTPPIVPPAQSETGCGDGREPCGAAEEPPARQQAAETPQEAVRDASGQDRARPAAGTPAGRQQPVADGWPAHRKQLVARGLKLAAGVRCEAGVLIAPSSWDRDTLIQRAGKWLAAKGYHAVTYDGAGRMDAVHIGQHKGEVRP